MKARSLKLREAHKSRGGASFCSVVWDKKAERLVTSSSSDPTISVHDGISSSASMTPTILRHHRDGVTALALSPNSTCLASGSIDRSVKLYKFPSGEFQTNITRFTLPIRILAFNNSGSLLAAAGDDEGIKLINTVDGSIARVLKGHKGPVTGLDFDPEGEYLASVDSTGTVMCWELLTGFMSHTLKNVAPDMGSDTSVVNVLRWSPNGLILAVPGLRNDVVMYDKFTTEKLFSLRGEHVEPICYLAWSPNGKYIATSGLDKQVLIWNVDQKQDIDRQKFEERICCMAWRPNGNALAVIDVKGMYGIWDSVVPSSMASPTEGIPSILSKKGNGLLLFDEENEEEHSFASGSLSDLGEDSHGEFQPSTRKRLRKRTFVGDDDIDEELNEELSLPSIFESKKKAHKTRKENLFLGNGSLRSIITSAKPKMQDPFQPGATPPQPGKRRFLCYNMLGCITTIERDGYSHIEIDFHDTGRGPRVPSMTDYFGFTMASINETGCVFANPCKGEKSMSTLMYRPFSSWASNSEWSMRFEGEEVKVVAIGSSWVAAVTSLNSLRIFSEGGLQKHILSLDGPVVTASGFKDELAVVIHVSDCLPSNVQVMEFRVFNMSSMTLPYRGRLPITPGSQLTWFGFSEEGYLSSHDSEGVFRVFTSQFGGTWIPVFSTSKEKRAEESYWVVGLDMNKLYCVACKHPELFPQVTPKPVLTLLDLSPPLASSDLGAGALENELMLKQLHIYEIQKRIDNMAPRGLDTTALDDEAFNLEVAQDRCILRLIGSCCSSDKLARASELMRLLSLEKSMRAAIKLVTKLKLPNLAERFNKILEERMLKEANEAANATLQTSKAEAISRDDSTVRLTSAPARKTETTETVLTSSATPKLSAPALVRKAKVSEESKMGKEASNRNEIENVKSKVMKDINLIAKPSNEEEKGKRKEVNQEEARRPSSNPFLKATV